MKKIFKSILAITLALIMSFGTLTAFAAEENTLKWYFNDEYFEEYTYYGEFKEGKNTVQCYEDSCNNKYYTFNANEGYYLFSFTNPMDVGNIDWLGTPKKYENEIAYDSSARIIDSYSEGELAGDYTYVYKFAEGETVIGVDAFYATEDTDIEVTVEYLGKNITDYDIPVKELVLNEDIYENATESISYMDLTVTFDETKTVDFKNIYVYFTSEEIKEGENVLSFEFAKIKKDITVTANHISYYIKDIELHNAEKYTQLSLDYNGDSWYYDFTDAVATVTFADSTQKDVFFYGNEASVELPNGKEYYIEACYYYDEVADDEHKYLGLYIGGIYVNSYKCTVEKYGILDNGSILFNDIRSEFLVFIDKFTNELDDATYFDTVSEIFTSLYGSFFDTLIYASRLFGGIFENIVNFIRFYLVG